MSAGASSGVEAARLSREGVGEDRSRRRASLAQFDARRAKAQRAGSSKQEWQASERGLTTNCRRSTVSPGLCMGRQLRCSAQEGDTATVATGDRRQATTARTVCLQYTSAGSACSDMLSACCMALHGDALSAAALLDGCWGRDVIRRAAGMGLSFPSTHRARTSINSSQFARPVRLASKRASKRAACSERALLLHQGRSLPGGPLISRLPAPPRASRPRATPRQPAIM